MKHFGDITKLSGYNLPVVDVITGGSPCQDLSVAGKRAGLDGERSGLFMEQVRITKEMRARDRANGRTGWMVRPRYMVWENVPGAFSSGKPKGADFAAVIEEIIKVAEPGTSVSVCVPNGGWTKSGCYYAEDGSWSIAWRVHDAQFWGVPQRRKRIALVADFGGLSASEILFERKGLSGNSEPCGEAGQETAGAAGGGTAGAGQINEWCAAVNKGAKHQQDLIQHDLGVARTLAPGTHASGSHLTKTLVTSGVEGAIFYDAYQHHGWRRSETSGTLTVGQNNTVRVDTPLITAYGIGGSVMGVSEDVTGALRAEEHGHQPLVVSNEGDIAGTLDASYYKGTGARNGKERTVVCVGNGQLNQMSMAEQANTLDTMHDQQAILCGNPWDPQSERVFHGDGAWHSLAGNSGGGQSRDAVMVFDKEMYNCGKHCTGTPQAREDTVAPTCRGDAHQSGVAYNAIVRRLTPLECERLQGYPDGWTDIGKWVDSKGKKHKDADSPRYKALGNSIALPFWQWMARRICAQYERPVTMASLFDGIGGFPLVFQRCGAVPVWASEIEEFPIAVTKRHFPEEE